VVERDPFAQTGAVEKRSSAARFADALPAWCSRTALSEGPSGQCRRADSDAARGLVRARRWQKHRRAARAARLPGWIAGPIIVSPRHPYEGDLD
jgi:hypothetical protein